MKTFSHNAQWNILHVAGIVLVTMSVLLLIVTFYPVMKEELKYQFLPPTDQVKVLSRNENERENKEESKSQPNVIVPIDEEFGIVIPKLGANAPVIADVDWQNSAEYQRVLAKGVAHARGTSLPGENGNIFIFSHSGVDFYEAARYNALFYLLNKLVSGDKVYLFYKGEKFVYTVTEKKTVSPDDIGALEGDKTKKTVTLMTCWPAGTTLKRLIVEAVQVES